MYGFQFFDMTRAFAMMSLVQWCD